VRREDDTYARSRGRRARLFGVAAGVLAVLAAAGAYELVHSLTTSAGAPPSRVAASRPTAPVVAPTAFQAKTGVKLTQMAVTGDGGLLDLRFQVLDSGKAASIHDTSPMLVDEGTGVVVNELYMGHRHKGLMRAGQGYYLLFNNPGNLVSRGSRVTVQLGHAQVAHVDVR
jgi:hypothetical protein